MINKITTYQNLLDAEEVVPLRLYKIKFFARKEERKNSNKINV